MFSYLSEVFKQKDTYIKYLNSRLSAEDSIINDLKHRIEPLKGRKEYTVEEKVIIFDLIAEHEESRRNIKNERDRVDCVNFNGIKNNELQELLIRQENPTYTEKTLVNLDQIIEQRLQKSTLAS